MSRLQAQKKKAPEQSAKCGVQKPVATRKSRKAKKGTPAQAIVTPASERILPNASTLKTDFFAVLDDLRRDVKKSEEGHRRAIRSAIARGCAVACFLEKHIWHWRKFCNANMWKSRNRKPDPKKPSQALRFVLLWMSKEKKRASKWYCAVGPLMKMGVGPADIPKAIKRAGGIEALARRNAKEKSSRRSENIPTLPATHMPTVSKATADNAVVLKGPLRQGGIGITLKATLEGEGESLLSLPIGSQPLLKIKILGRTERGLKIAVLKVSRGAAIK